MSIEHFFIYDETLLELEMTRRERTVERRALYEVAGVRGRSFMSVGS